MTRPRVKVRIERLVLEGVAPRDRAAVVAAFRAELARMLAAGDVAPASRVVPAVSLAAPTPADAASAGRAAAAALGRAIGGGRR